MVLKINGIFEARRGKKRMKRVSQSTESSSGRGEVSPVNHESRQFGQKSERFSYFNNIFLNL